MQSINCERHQLKKNFILCLENDCQDRLVCQRCYTLDQKHNSHQYVMIDFFIKDDKYELERVLGDDYIKNNRNMDEFIQQFDNKMNKYLDEREEDMRTSFEKMIYQYRQQFQQLKQQKYEEFNIKDIKSIEYIQQNLKYMIDNDTNEQDQMKMKQQIDGYRNIKNIQERLDLVKEQIQQNDEQMMKQIQDIFDESKVKQDIIFRQQINNLQQVEDIKKCKDKIHICNSSEINNYRNQVVQFQQQDKDYRIEIDFYTSNTDLNFKQQVIDMVDQLNVNHRVGIVKFDIRSDNPISNELLVKMVNRYDNLYDIQILDRYDQIQNDIHTQLKLITKKSTVLQFILQFCGSLNSNDQGFNLLKQYNEIIKNKQYLQQLYYYHSKINSDTSNKQEIQQMIDRVTNM